jgi:predicted nucleic acid-binding protein
VFLEREVVDSDTISHDFRGNPRVVFRQQTRPPEASGTAIGPHDTLIAATALRHQATPITRHVRESARVPGLQCVNWLETSLASAGA